jgi:murein DD-endopeptidase MepM/ murein hydrolase activator NlpD
VPGRSVVAAALIVVCAPIPAGVPPSSAGRRAAGAIRAPANYAAPVPLSVVRPFAPPATRYGPGHLGVDLRVQRREVVRAAGNGVVRFAGSVAGRGVVVIGHGAGISTEYEPVRPLVRAGATVSRGQPLGEISGRHPGCPGQCLH